MTGRPLRARRALEQQDPSPSDREQAIIDAATSVPMGLPELHAAGRMFFRFDPGFRAELDEARQDWRDLTALLPRGGRSAEQLDVDEDVVLESRRRAIALRLATWWGLDLRSTINAVALDTAPTYPVGQVRYSCTDPETGYHFVEIRVESAYAWQRIKSALAEMEWLAPVGHHAWFWDRPEGSRQRLRGMNGRVAARALALHFLTEPPTGERPSGGTRLWREALELWDSSVGGEMRVLDRDYRPHWERDRLHLMRFVIGRSRDPVQLLMNAQQEGGHGDANWSSRLGIDPDDWRRLRAEEPVSREVWERIEAFSPDVARAVAAYRQVGLLKLALDISP